MGRYALDSSAANSRLTSTTTSACLIRCRSSITSRSPAVSAGRWRTGAGSPTTNRASCSIPEKSSAETKQNIYEVIAHEIAHMWFGDLVTMAWWDNLWLNEGFASWMGTKCTAKFNPDWEVWLSKNVPRDPTRRYGHRQGKRHGRRCALDHASDPATDRQRSGGEQRLRRHHLPKRAVVHHACWRVFSAKKFFATAFANTWRRTNFRTRPRPISGIRFPKPRANRSREIAAAWTEQPGFPDRERGARCRAGRSR